MPDNNQPPSPGTDPRWHAQYLRLHANLKPRTKRLSQVVELRDQLYRDLDQLYPWPLGTASRPSQAHTHAEQVKLAHTTYTVVDTLLTEVLDWQRLALTLQQRIDEMMTAVPHVAPEHAGKTWALGSTLGDVLGRANLESTAFTAKEYAALADTWAFEERPFSQAQQARFAERSRQLVEHLRLPFDYTPGNLPEPPTATATPSDNLSEPPSAPDPTTPGNLPEGARIPWAHTQRALTLNELIEQHLATARQLLAEYPPQPHAFEGEELLRALIANAEAALTSQDPPALLAAWRDLQEVTQELAN